jgi:hypothetical protein
MPADVLEHGRERPPGKPRPRTVAVVLAGLAVVAAGVAQGRGDAPGGDRSANPPRAGVLLERAAVLSVRETTAGVLHVRIGMEGAARARLLSVTVDLPGTALAHLPTPDRLTDDGTGLLVVDLLPRCPGALDGLARGEVTAAVHGQGAASAEQVRVPLVTDGPLADAVRARCGTVARVPELRTSSVGLDGPAGDPLRTRVDVSAAGDEPVTVVAVRPGPGLEVAVRTPLPVVLRPGRRPVTLRVDLRLEGCGGASDTPPFLLVLSTGEVVATSVAAEVLPPLEVLRPYQCAGDLPSGGT